MAIKVYTKRANSQRERKLQKALQDFVSSERKTNPGFEIEPAENVQQLQRNYDKYCTTTVDFEEIKPTRTKAVSDNDASDQSQHSDTGDDTGAGDEAGQGDTDHVKYSGGDSAPEAPEVADPFNRAEPVVRAYVADDDGFSSSNTGESTGSRQTSFSEPSSFSESFEMPVDAQSDTGSSAIGPGQGSPGQGKKTPPPKSPPLNPVFDEMAANKKRKSSKKFARYIVEVVCMLTEKGFVWFANKDINDGKLAEYEINGEMDLSLPIAMDDGQKATVKEFFRNQCLTAEKLSKIDAQEKEDLADALTEVLLEKGVGPTPMQELLLITAKVIGGQALTLMALNAQNQSVLTQLRAMHAPGEHTQTQAEPARQYKEPEHAAQPKTEPQAQQDPEPKPEPPADKYFRDDKKEQDKEPVLQIGESKPTIE